MSFKDFFRLIFVLFCLYLLGDAFSRWDGFSHYASFAEFIPSVSLAFVLWTIVALLFAVTIWAFLKLFELFFVIIKLQIGKEHLFLNAFFFLLLAILTWKAKKLLWPDIHTDFHIKLSVLVSVTLLSIYLSWLFHCKAGRFIEIIMERLTPLVWIFGIILFLSFSLVTYHTWIKRANNVIAEETASSSGAWQDRPNIILVSFDALAAREMSLYGYPRETTPFITDWAKEATIFMRAESSSNFTTPAAASLMTGKRVWTHQTYHIAGTKPVRSDVESMPALLKANGYFNMAFIVNPFASVEVLGMSNSFDISPLSCTLGFSESLFGWKFGIIDVLLSRTFSGKIRLYNWILTNEFIFSKLLNLISRNISITPVPPQKAFDMFLETLDENHQKPFFAWIHLFPPHDPYLPPEPFKGIYNSSPGMRTYKKQEKLIEESYVHLFQHQPFPNIMDLSVNLMRDYYDEFITYVNKTYEDFIAKFSTKNMKNTVIILTADHGESFDHGYFTHGGPFLYEQVTHIPLIIKEPGQADGVIINDLVEQIDIPATILDLANIPVPSWMEGRSLVPLMRGKELHKQPAFSMNFEENASRGSQINEGSIAIWQGEYKLIHYLGRNESLMFNLMKDPNELDNLFVSDHRTGQYLLNILKKNLDVANKQIPMTSHTNLK